MICLITAYRDRYLFMICNNLIISFSIPTSSQHNLEDYSSILITWISTSTSYTHNTQDWTEHSGIEMSY